MKNTIIHRYAFLPNYNMKTQEYSWRKLKVVKVWAIPNTFGLDLNYILEDCSRFNQYNLYTEDKIESMCPKQHHNLILDNLNMRGFRFRSQTIFSPATEQDAKRRGSVELMKLIEDSRKDIQDCIDNNYIIGEKIVKKLIK